MYGRFSIWRGHEVAAFSWGFVHPSHEGHKWYNYGIASHTLYPASEVGSGIRNIYRIWAGCITDHCLTFVKTKANQAKDKLMYAWRTFDMELAWSCCCYFQIYGLSSDIQCIPSWLSRTLSQQRDLQGQFTNQCSSLVFWRISESSKLDLMFAPYWTMSWERSLRLERLQLWNCIQYGI